MANHLFVQTNSPAGNQILVHAWVEDGALTLVETVDTGGVEAGMAGLVRSSAHGSFVYDADPQGDRRYVKGHQLRRTDESLINSPHKWIRNGLPRGWGHGRDRRIWAGAHRDG